MTHMQAILTAAEPYGFKPQEGGACPLYLARDLRDGRSLAIATPNDAAAGMEHSDPTSPLFIISGTEADGSHWGAPSESNPDPMPLAAVLDIGQMMARRLDNTASPTYADGRHWRDEFPSFPEADMPPLPPHWEDVSWGNETAPHFICYRARPDDEEDSLCIWINESDPTHREYYPDFILPRFGLYRMDSVGNNIETIHEGDDWTAVLMAIFTYAIGRPIQTREQARGLIRAMVDAGRDFHLEDSPESIIQLADGVPLFTAEECAQLRERQDDIYGLDCWTAEECPCGEILAYRATFI